MRIREKGIVIGKGISGEVNLITDVEGVTVGHCTIDEDDVHTGVTAVLPGVDLSKERPVAAAFVLNGYGKTLGTIEIEELGVLETPILLTNTLNTGSCADALVRYMIDLYDESGKTLRSINPVVGETNDSRISDIREQAVRRKHVMTAITHADTLFSLGAAGAGRGTVCFGLKGGIGSASRKLTFEGRTYTIGILVQTNFGALRDLLIQGKEVGREFAKRIRELSVKDEGSMMAVLATDLPLSSRQLKRVLKRITVGMIRTGSIMGHGSGDVFLGFTTGNRIPVETKDMMTIELFPEDALDYVFRNTAEAAEEAILDSMFTAEAMTGLNGERYHSLAELI